MNNAVAKQRLGSKSKNPGVIVYRFGTYMAELEADTGQHLQVFSASEESCVDGSDGTRLVTRETR